MINRKGHKKPKEQLIEMASAGNTGAEIAAALGYASPGSALMALRRLGLSPKDMRAETRAKILPEVWAGLRGGMSIRALARKHGIDPRTMGKMVRENPPPPLPPVELAPMPAKLPRIVSRKAADVQAPAPRVKIKFGFTPAAIKRYEARA